MCSEQSIFTALATLCSSPGYVHALAFLCYRDNLVRYSGDLKSEHVQHLFSESHLIRTEISTLVGLMVQNDIDYTLPSQVLVAEYTKKSETLLHELHLTFTDSFFANLDSSRLTDKSYKPFTS